MFNGIESRSWVLNLRSQWHDVYRPLACGKSSTTRLQKHRSKAMERGGVIKGGYVPEKKLKMISSANARALTNLHKPEFYA